MDTIKKDTELKNWLTDTSNSIFKCRSLTSVKREWNEAREALNSVKSTRNGATSTITETTKRKAITRLRDSLKSRMTAKSKERILKYALEVCTYGKEDAARFAEYEAGQLEKMITHTNQLTEKDIEALIEQAIKALDSYDFAVRACAISLLSGRRAGEILKTATFRRTRGQELNFSGQLKTKNPRPYRIPVLHTPNAIIKSLNFMRTELTQHLEGKSLEVIEHETNGKLNKVAKLWIGKTHHFHDLRKIYTAILLHRGAHIEAKLTSRAYARNILGHSDLKTSVAYENWQIIAD